MMQDSLDSVARVSCVKWCGCETVMRLGFTGDIAGGSARSPSVTGGYLNLVRPFSPLWDTKMMTRIPYSLFEFSLPIGGVLEPRRSSESSE